ncbi:MAG: ABC transporter permease [Christensenellaceae bacterium]|jgi:spermidine/putrescine transport system permease protein|nr:ABC transporter permease [Christensenellaceae bacterium]
MKQKPRNTKQKTPKFTSTFVLIVIAILYLPILLIVLFSFSENNVVSFSNDFNFGFGLFAALFNNADIMDAVWHTFLIAVVASFIATIIATMAGVGILSMKQKRRSAIMALNQLPIINADIVTSFSIVLLFVTLGLTNVGFFKLILAHTLIALPFALLMIMPRLRQLDDNLFDAALDLGATPFRAFLTVIIPQLLPAMLNAFLLGFTLSLDDFAITQYNNDDISTISTEVYGAMNRRYIPPEMRALTTIIFVAIFCILVIINVVIKNKKKENPQNG